MYLSRFHNKMIWALVKEVQYSTYGPGVYRMWKINFESFSLFPRASPSFMVRGRRPCPHSAKSTVWLYVYMPVKVLKQMKRSITNAAPPEKKNITETETGSNNKSQLRYLGNAWELLERSEMI